MSHYIEYGEFYIRCNKNKKLPLKRFILNRLKNNIVCLKIVKMFITNTDTTSKYKRCRLDDNYFCLSLLIECVNIIET